MTQNRKHLGLNHLISCFICDEGLGSLGWRGGEHGPDVPLAAGGGYLVEGHSLDGFHVGSEDGISFLVLEPGEDLV